MPRPTPIAKVSPTEGHGATVILEGEKFEDAYAHAVEVGKTRGLTFVHPFDDADIIAGQGTIALEMLETAPEIDTLVVTRSEEHTSELQALKRISYAVFCLKK